ncbi:MAG: GNAT family N-acetyltransferase [Spirochaetes bacterium]|nr:GNAT family N-acetyltransferase [Spirochaetota bacterium]
MYTIRPVNENDLATVCGFIAGERETHYAFPDVAYPLTVAVLRKFVESRSDATILMEDGTPVGFADLFNIKRNVQCYIGNVMIDKNHRDKGAGRRLIQEMVDIAVLRHNVTRIVIPCWSENTPAVLLYTRLGFRPFEIMIKNHNDSEAVPVLLFEKNIDTDLPDPSPVGTL